MICTRCATAADAQLPAGQHCTDPGCTCGHRTEDYRPTTGYDVVARFYDRFAAIADQATEVHRRDTVIPIGEVFAFATPRVDRTANAGPPTPDAPSEHADFHVCTDKRPRDYCRESCTACAGYENVQRCPTTTED